MCVRVYDGYFYQNEHVCNYARHFMHVRYFMYTLTYPLSLHQKNIKDGDELFFIDVVHAIGHRCVPQQTFHRPVLHLQLQNYANVAEVNVRTFDDAVEIK